MALYFLPFDCVTVTTFPPTEIVAVRDWAVGFADAEYATVPLPLPLLPEVIASQDALLWASQAQELPACTVEDDFPPLPPSVWLSGETEYWHDWIAVGVGTGGGVAVAWGVAVGRGVAVGWGVAVAAGGGKVGVAVAVAVGVAVFASTAS